MKAYIAKWNLRDAPENHITDFWFNSKIEGAAVCFSEEQAEIECALLNKQRITIPSSPGGLYTIRDFKVEKRADGEFVIFAEAPFIPETGTSEAKKTERPAK